MSASAGNVGEGSRRPTGRHAGDDWPYEEALLDAAFAELAEKIDGAWRGEMKRVLGEDVSGRSWEEYWEPLGSSFADFAFAAWDRPVFSRGGASDAVLDSIGLKKEGPFKGRIHEHRPYLRVIAAIQTMRVLEASQAKPLLDAVFLAKLLTVEFSHAYCALVLDHRWQLSLCDKAHVNSTYNAERLLLREGDSRLDLVLSSWEESKLAKTLQKRIGLATELHTRVTAGDVHGATDGTTGDEGFGTSGPQSKLLNLGNLPQEVLERVIQCMDAEAMMATSMTCKAMSALVKAELCPQPNVALRAARAALVAVMRRKDSAEDDEGGDVWLGFEKKGSRAAQRDDSSAVHLDGSRPMVTTLGRDAQATVMMEMMKLFLRHAGLGPKDRPAMPSSDLGPPPTPMSSKLARFNAQPMPPGHHQMPGSPPGSIAAAVRDGIFDVKEFYKFCTAAMVSMGGDTMAVARAGGYKQRKLVLDALLLSPRRDEEGPGCFPTCISHGFESIQQLHVDAGSGIVWCAGILRKGRAGRGAARGCRIAGFSTVEMRRPGQGDDDLDDLYDVSRDAMMKHMLKAGPTGKRVKRQAVVGIHSDGDILRSVTCQGLLQTWDLWRLPERARGPDGGLSGLSDSDNEECDDYFHEGPLNNDNYVDCYDPPHSSEYLQLPRNVSGLVKAVVVCSGGVPRTLVATHGRDPLPSLVEDRQGQELLMYDWETRRLLHQCLGHQRFISDVAVAPESGGMSQVLATSSFEGSVKIWDMRSSMPVMTLTNAGSHDPALCCCFADFSHDGGHQGATPSVLFAGWGQGVLAWDLRAASAHAMYEMSSGNGEPYDMTWHSGSGSLLVNTALPGANRMGEIYQDDFEPVYGNAAEDDEAYDDEPEHWWPKNAQHSTTDFRQVWSMYDSKMLRYTFTHAGFSAAHGGESALKRVRPIFHSDYY